MTKTTELNRAILQILTTVLLMFIGINLLKLEGSWLFLIGYFAGVIITAWNTRTGETDGD